MSIPASAMTLTARGSRPCFSVPAEWASILSPYRCRTQPSAIWLLQAFPVQRKRILNLLRLDPLTCDIVHNLSEGDCARFQFPLILNSTAMLYRRFVANTLRLC